MEKRKFEEINNMRPAEREKAQFECIKNALIVEKKSMTVKDMSDYLRKKGFKKAASEKTIYRRVLPELRDVYGIVKKRNLYFYDKTIAIENERANRAMYNLPHENIITNEEIIKSIQIIFELAKIEKPNEQLLLKNFLDFCTNLALKNEKSYFFY